MTNASSSDAAMAALWVRAFREAGNVVGLHRGDLFVTAYPGRGVNPFAQDPDGRLLAWVRSTPDYCVRITEYLAAEAETGADDVEI